LESKGFPLKLRHAGVVLLALYMVPGTFFQNTGRTSLLIFSSFPPSRVRLSFPKFFTVGFFLPRFFSDQNLSPSTDVQTLLRFTPRLFFSPLHDLFFFRRIAHPRTFHPSQNFRGGFCCLRGSTVPFSASFFFFCLFSPFCTSGRGVNQHFLVIVEFWLDPT